MLHLIQLINYMVNNLEYTEEQVEEHFEYIIDRDLPIEMLYDTVGLECPVSDTSLQLLQVKLSKWRSALKSVLLLSGKEE